MARRKWRSVSTDQILSHIRKAGISEANRLQTASDGQAEEMEDLNERIQHILSIANNIHRKPTDMVYLVMYDIESNKVRTLVAKYLIAQGCLRIQNSIFMADTSPEVCESIKQDLADVQASYDNQDSILVVPLTTSNVESMHVIGRNVDLDLVLKNRNTLFF